MVRLLAGALVFLGGCYSARIDMPREIERRVQEVAPVRANLDVAPQASVPQATSSADPLDLTSLWNLALANNPSLREAAAQLEAAHGHWIQKGLYPNPRVIHSQDTIGSPIAHQGNLAIQLSQEIVTAGKRRLDRDLAGQEKSAAAMGLIGRKFEVLTRIRRAYNDYLGELYLLQLTGESVATLERGIAITTQQVEKAKTRPQTDLIRLEALLEEARISQARARDTLEGAWRQLAAEVGVPDLAVPKAPGQLADDVPVWQAEQIVAQVLANNTLLKQAAIEVEHARLAVDRAKAGAIPNVMVGAGYSLDNTDQTAGGLISVETAIPVWDRQQGAQYEAKARFVAAQAAVRSTSNRLQHDIAEAFARYSAAKRQVERLNKEVLPRLQESLELLRKAYQAGSAQVTFSDILMTEQNLNSTRLTLAGARRATWLAIADLQGLMQLDVDEDGPTPNAPGPQP